ncbi:DUF1566 domain-containing protein [Alteromonas sp. ASW11-19]|uniref:DUF1566 domain-containing protein n=1 Tax=Alteromonas salexigens TaxID=2982530 RepID=A0ABT2VNG3_9ALTE|nr:DUF1566 domain-containing protein [Alteromonas salexigens]MCU7554842.1 DUF1566 domain-containing protein [Alteromonas salexigens]
MTLFRHATYVLAALMLFACGGSGSDDDTPNRTLYVSAGADRSVSEGASVTLSAEASGGDGALIWRWIATPTLSITHADTSLPAATFVAPTLATARDYTITVTVTDASGVSASDSLVVSVQPDNSPPVADIAVADWPGLTTGFYPAGVAVTLDAAGSTDADAADAANPIASYTWTQTQGTDVLTDVMTEQAQLVITTPIASERQILAFTVEVTDDEGATDTTAVQLTVQSASETVPVIEAGVSQAVFSGEHIVLEGNAYTTIPSASPLAVSWESDATIQAPNSLSTYAIAPQVNTYTEYVFTLTVVDANGNQVDDTLTVAVRPYPVARMNDTGVTVQATTDAITLNQQNLWPGQDGQRGSDVIAQSGALPKAGDGEAGFDFTKLNSNGDEQDADSGSFSCVRDNVTGLVWEVKTDANDLHDKDHRYSWYQTEDNGGFAGDENAVDTSCTLTNCNTQAYVNAVNAQGLCGFYDWRMPTHHELLSLVHFGRTSTAMIDVEFFPYTGELQHSPLWYWTVIPGADGVQDDAAQNAWAIDFASGVDNFLNKSTAGSIRLVRAGRSAP